jgi:hypothetical protein
VAASEEGTRIQELMRRFLEAAYDRRNSYEWRGISMYSVCNDISLEDRAICQKVMNLHHHFGNITEVKGGPQIEEPGWFKLTPKSIAWVQRQRGG